MIIIIVVTSYNDLRTLKAMFTWSNFLCILFFFLLNGLIVL